MVTVLPNKVLLLHKHLEVVILLSPLILNQNNAVEREGVENLKNVENLKKVVKENVVEDVENHVKVEDVVENLKKAVEEKDVELNKPKVGGPKKYYVYVKDPKTGNVKKVTFGDTTGLKVKLDDKEARKSFAARHNCDQQTDRTKAGYWSCNLPRYAKQLELSGGGNFFW